MGFGDNKMNRVLIIDDDHQICLYLKELIEQMGHEFVMANTVSEGVFCARETAFDLILLDLGLPDGHGLDLMPELIKMPYCPEIIIITGAGDVRGAEIAFKYGAWDYLQKPFYLDEVMLSITRALQYRKEKKALKPPVSLHRSNIVGESGALQKCLEDVARAAVTNVSVLVTGETGTGKELFAKAVHENSRRAAGPFIAVDCGALPETLVESILFGYEKGAFTGAQLRQDGLIAQADGGTLLLDEVGELPLTAQKSFLRTLQERCVRPVGGKSEKPVDFRLVAATNLDLNRLVKEKMFREDLLYRIHGVEIKLPPLRDRGKDIEEIAVKKIHELARRHGLDTKAISPEFFQTLDACYWPGNVRELINVLEYAMIKAEQDPTLFPKHLPPEYRTPGLDFDSFPAFEPGRQPVSIQEESYVVPCLRDYRISMEKKYLEMLLKKTGGDIKQAIVISGISQSRFYALLKKHRLSGFDTGS
jgi:two-component system, NtrC family, response regulator